MTARAKRQTSAPFWLQNIRDHWRRFFADGDIMTLVIVTAMLLIPPLALHAADWPLSLEVIIPVGVLSAALGLIFSRSRFGELMALIISSTYGVCLVLMLTAMTVDSNIGNGIYTVFERAIQWIADATAEGINQDDMVFTLLVALLFWFLGYNAAWHTFRIDRVWRVILPPGLILFTNIVFYSGNTNLDGYLVGYLFLSLILIARSNLDNREWEWHSRGIRMPRRLRRQFINLGAVLAAVVVAAGWIIPSQDLTKQSESFRDFLQSNPVREISEFWSRMFSPIEAQGPTTADYYGGNSLELGGSIRLGDQEVFYVAVPNDGRRYYWRSRIFDTYEAGRWTPAAQIRLTDREAPTDLLIEPTQSRELVQQTFTSALNVNRIVYTAPQPLQVDLPTSTDLAYTAPESAANRTMNVSVIRPTSIIERGDSYTATSLMSVATAEELRSASTTYPEWVTDLYLYVSPSVTQRTRDLALQIVTEAQATTVYDRAKAIEDYLRRTITYNETIPLPPRDQDPVDWVLFDYQQGYCNYYASAMIVMLRSLGIPARMAAGFAQGNWDAERSAFVVTERDAHTWVEVYFPGYGWIEFEPTQAQAELNRDDQQTNNQEQVAPQAPPTFTPTPSPVPTNTLPPTPTEDGGSDNDDQNSSNPPPPTPTFTPTPSPTPTATPVIVPTQPAPTPPDSTNPISMLLPALGIVLIGLVVLFVLMMIALFIYWWWEWRGMGGLSPITRAYARLERYIGLIGIRLGDEETTEERRRHIIRAIPKAQRPVTAITRLYTTERYGPRNPNPNREARRTEAAEEAWIDARSNILRRWARKFRFWRRGDDD
jgi:transglutaminase-like putative cysteine protease